MQQTEFGLDVASPLFTLLTLASSVSNERLIMCMYEMCGTFAVCKIAPQVKSALVRRYADILLSNEDGSRECLVECQGKSIHGSIESKISDSDRTTALQAMGYPVVLLTYGQLADSDAFRVVMELIMSYLDMPLKDKTPRQQELERRLREEIFIDWAGM